jgi:chorismate dehydratase
MLKICAVSYLNTKPYVVGLEHLKQLENIEYTLEYPSLCAKKFIKNEVDIALLPVAVLKNLIQPYFQFANMGIASNGSVNTVCLFSQNEINNIHTIYLDYQSKTSVELIKILCRNLWHISPVFKPLTQEEINLGAGEAVVVIGDRAIPMLAKYKFVYDLGEHWKELYHLPFVFAIWVSNKELPPRFIQNFKDAMDIGFHNIDEIVATYDNVFSDFNFSIKKYLNSTIVYNLSDKYFEGMNKFLELLD